MAFNSESLPVELDGVSYLVDTTQYGRTTVPALREQRDNSKEPGENTLDTSGAWTRSQTDWSYGGGQTHFDLDDSDRRRFDTSSGVDPWTKGQITLLPITEQKKSAASTNQKVRRVGAYLYFIDAETVCFTTDPTSASPTWTEFTARATYSVTDLDSDGTYVYLAFGSGVAIGRSTISASAIDGAWPSSGTQEADIISVASGRLIGALGANIFEIGANGAKLGSSLDYTPALAGTTWVDVTGGPSGIYAAANTDDTGTIYHIGVSATDGTLQTPIIGGELPQGEKINDIKSYGGILLIATNIGLRTALIDTSSNAVTIGPVIEDGGEAFCLDVDSKFVWWGAESGELYRADLTKFTETLVPAWASDIVSSAGSASDVQSIARLGSKTYFADKGNGCYGESGTGVKVLAGTLTIGEVSWSTVAPKLLRNVTVRQDRSQYTFGDTDYNVTLTDYRDESLEYRGNPSSTLLGSLSFAATNDNNATSSLSLTPNIAKNFSFVSESSVSYKFVITLGRHTDTTSAPIVEDWLTSCIATPARVDEIILPIVLQRQVLTSRNSGAPKAFSSTDVFTTLRNRMETGQTLSYKEGDREENVTIERLSMQPDRLSDDGSWWEGTLLVRLLTVPS
jgi:hypothetical protein|tara:strand:+ start:2163 stop:4034 length:1872 start_codon:yes stop_codon:yes gene_type:complete